MDYVKVSVIIPVYGVEQYVDRCVTSLLSQSLQEIELLFIDDCSPDKSIDIIKDKLKSSIGFSGVWRIITHDVNKGLPSARNTGLKVAQGAYIFHCDADDWLEPFALEHMYEMAKRDDADIVYSDYYISFAKNERYIHNVEFESSDSFLNDGLLSGSIKYNVWNKLVKRSLYSNYSIQFPDGHSMGEDMTMIMLANSARTVCFLNEATYHYNKMNVSSFTNSFSKKQLLDIKYNADRVIDCLVNSGKYVDPEPLNLFKLSVKLPFLFSNQIDMIEEWRKWYPESNSYIFRNKTIPLRTRLIQFCASKRFDCIVRLYNLIINNIIYGIIYR